MKIYKVTLWIDTGYDWLRRVCVLYADSEEDAKTKAHKYFNSRLRGEKFANVESVVEIEKNDSGIIYQDYFKTT